MDLSSLEITPAEGKIVLTLLEDDNGDAETYDAGLAEPLLLALVAGVGPKVTGVKKDDTVAVYSWARTCPTLGANTHICDSYVVLAKITTK